MRKVRVGINGFGRIGRIVFRVGWENLEIVGINDLGDAHTAAHLLKYDSSHGRFGPSVDSDENHLIVDGKKIPISGHRDPALVPWKAWGADIVLECSGAFKDKADFHKHIQAGAKKVIVSAPANVDLTVVFGINHEQYNPAQHQVLSNASCTTNCLAPLAMILNDEFGIQNGFMTTIHSYTNDQKVLDAPHKDLRRARTAAVSMIPTTTGAAKAVGEVLPALKGKVDGVSVRVPTSNVSLVDLVAWTEKPVSVASVNEALTRASVGRLKGILAVESAPLVSVDYMGNSFSSIVDLPSTMVVGTNMVKVFSWYDNEVGFSNRMVDLTQYVAGKGF